MYEDFYFSDYPYAEIRDFGVFHLNVDEAAELVAKILCLEGTLTSGCDIGMFMT